MRLKTLSLMMTTTTLGSSGVDARLFPTAAERAAGRFMRAPDGHGDAGGDGGGSSGDAGGGDAAAPGGAADGDAGAGGGDQGGSDAGAGDGTGGDQGDAGSGGKPETILGGAAEGEGDGGDQAGKGDGAKDGAQEGEEGAGNQAVEVLGAPEKYDIALPEAAIAAGMAFDKEAFDAVEPVLRELNLSNDAAKALVTAYTEKVLPLLEKRGGERLDAAGADMARNWEAEARADPEIGGAKFDETKALARQTFIRFGVKSDGPFLKLLEESKLGNHPDMLRFVANVGRLTGEANVDVGGGGQAPQRLADRVYGSPTPRE